MGYCQLTRRLRHKYDLKVRRDTVMRALSIIDPEGVERLKKRALKRRYGTPGPNFYGMSTGGINFPHLVFLFMEL